ncbi:hypothetical protein PANO111632_12300 [Paracoccus nototheniae]
MLPPSQAVSRSLAGPGRLPGQGCQNRIGADTAQGPPRPPTESPGPRIHTRNGARRTSGLARRADAHLRGDRFPRMGCGGLTDGARGRSLTARRVRLDDPVQPDDPDGQDRPGCPPDQCQPRERGQPRNAKGPPGPQFPPLRWTATFVIPPHHGKTPACRRLAPTGLDRIDKTDETSREHDSSSCAGRCFWMAAVIRYRRLRPWSGSGWSLGTLCADAAMRALTRMAIPRDILYAAGERNLAGRGGTRRMSDGCRDAAE